jgi:hypothetical protein
MWSAFVSTPTEFFYTCFDCFSADTPGNTSLTASLPLNAEYPAHHLLYNNPTFDAYSNNSDLTAEQISSKIFEDNCVTGAMVIKRFVGEHVYAIKFLGFAN